MNADDHLIQISGQYLVSLQMQLALARAERDAALEKINILETSKDTTQVTP